MLLGNLLKSVNENYKKIDVKGIAFDSRKIKKGYIFFAVEGRKESGFKFIKHAVLKGASVIVSRKKQKNKKNSVAFISVKDVRKNLAEASSNFYKKKPRNIIAVTGTNGKSSVAHFFCQILNFNNIRCASIGTLGIISKNYRKNINLTTLDPLSLNKNLKLLAEKKIDNVILEASSHGLDQKRLDNIKIKTGIFTNLSHDHLDYHKNMKSYLNSKMYLFKNLLNKNSRMIADEEIDEFKIIKNIAKKRKIKKITIGTKSGNIKILENKYKGNNQMIKISLGGKFFLVKIPLIGYFQIKNLFLAILAALNCGLDKKKIFNQIQNIKPVPGRLECVANLKNDSKIILDFAHTPDALEQSLIALIKQFKKKIVIVFGCGGERDKKKRLTMGRIAKKYCHKIFVTDDNPRRENPQKIRKAILKGCKKNAVDIGSRKKAIERAVNELRSNELLLVAGKGHERTQDYGNKIVKFSDKKIIKEAIQKKNFHFDKNNYQKSLLIKAFDNKNLKNISYSGVSINTQTIKKNNIFFAIHGKKKDGHNFIKEAIKKGAAKIVISKRKEAFPKSKILKVKNTLSSLNNLARVTRSKTSAQIIGITGSVGKTTLKNLISFSLKSYGKVYKSPHSYNNKFGVPLSLSNLKKNTRYGVFEIGMDKKGEINNLSKMVKPGLGVITNIGGAHFKNFNTLKDIAKAKSEIIENIEDEGKLILNKDDKFFSYFYKKAKKNNIEVISFSSKKKADIYLINLKKINNYFKLKIFIKEKIYYFKTKNSTNNFVSNLLACISILFALNLDLNKVSKKFINFSIPSGRGDKQVIKKFRKKFTLIDESYNANPLSMSSAIQNMNFYERKNNSKKIAFLGDMLELGKKTKKFHNELATLINRSDIDKIFVYGKYIKSTFNLLNKNKRGKVFNNLSQAYNYLSKIINNNDILMIKGSNATGLSQFSKNIKRI